MQDGSTQGLSERERNAAPVRYLSLVDGVRGIAALAILLYHYVHFFMSGPNRRADEGVTQLFPGYDALWVFYDYGYLAVQVFWLISGFVFAQVYYGSEASTRSFAVNRFARLYPLHLLTLLVVVALQLAALHHFGYSLLYAKFDAPHFVEQLFMASDWLREDGGYSFNGPIWSVSVEIAIYALFWLSRGWVKRFGLGLLLVMVLGFYVAHDHWGEVSRVFSCGFYFFFGCALANAQKMCAGDLRKLAIPLVLLLGFGFYGAGIGSNWGLRYLVIPGLGGALFLVLAETEVLARPGLRRICEWLGENTYGIYLWHVPLQLTLLLILKPQLDPSEVAQNWWFLLGFVILTVMLARVSFAIFERPARDALRRRLGGTLATAKGGDKPVTAS